MSARNEKGKFLPGNPGRPSGVPNKATKLQREFIQDLLDNQQAKIKRELGKLKGKDYINAITCLMEYTMPKLSRTELTGDSPRTIQIITGMEIK